MREPSLFHASAIGDLEDAVHLLRRAPLSTLLCHVIGSAPFTLAALLFWNDITQYRPSATACMIDSLLLAVMLAWMNCWRAIFAAKLRAQLSGAVEVRASVWRMAGYQALLGASKLIVLPLAALVAFPLATAVAFYRYAAVLSCRTDLSFRQVVVRASKLAGIDRRQSWTVLAAAALLQALVTLNVAMVLAMLPYLVRMLTGYESVFSRSGMSFLMNPLFVMTVLTVGWMAIDPFLQAVYCVMLFRRESLETGEDLRTELRRIPRAALAALAALCMFCCSAGNGRAANAVSPDALRQSVGQAMQAHEYDWRLPEAAAPNRPSWLVDSVNRLFHGIAWTVEQVGNLVGRLLDWIFGKISMPGAEGSAPAHALSLGIYVVIAVILILAGLLAGRILKARRARPKRAVVAVAVPVRLEDESVTPDQLPEDQWIEMGEKCLREQNHRLALRAFYLANLAWLGRREWIAIHPGKTNREYENELRRRARAFAEARGLFAENIASFERVWYGLHPVEPIDVELFRERNARIKTALDRPAVEAA